MIGDLWEIDLLGVVLPGISCWKIDLLGVALPGISCWKIDLLGGLHYLVTVAESCITWPQMLGVSLPGIRCWEFPDLASVAGSLFTWSQLLGEFLDISLRWVLAERPESLPNLCDLNLVVTLLVKDAECLLKLCGTHLLLHYSEWFYFK